MAQEIDNISTGYVFESDSDIEDIGPPPPAVIKAITELNEQNKQKKSDSLTYDDISVVLWSGPNGEHPSPATSKDAVPATTTEKKKRHLHWDRDIEKLLIRWCDHAKCYHWMYTRSHDIAHKKSRRFMIIVNILTTLAGMSNIIAGSYSINGFQLAWVFGIISIMASSLNLLQDKLGYTQSIEAYKKLSLQWLIIRNKIEETLSVPPLIRGECRTFMKYIRSDINQAILEKNSMIPSSVKKELIELTKDVKFDKPDMLGHFIPTEVYVHAAAKE